jgi:manganese/zinc/iron transport system permease protein
VIGFFITQDISSPILVVAAALTGVLTVSLVEILNRTRLVKEDAAIGLVFPALFSMAVVLISRYAGDVHLDTDAVLLGELAFAPFDRFAPFGTDIGPRGFYVMGGILLINLLFIVLFFKELKIATFDAGLAATLGFAPAILHYILMGLVSVTAVRAFDNVGSILVVALMIVPPVSAYMLTDRLPRMIGLSALIGAVGAVGGYWLARALDASIAGSMATASGIIFALVFLFAPERGMVAMARRRVRQRYEFAETALLIHLLNHENKPEADQESQLDHLRDHFNWDDAFAARIQRSAVQRGVVSREGSLLQLTEYGRVLAQQEMVQ